MFRTQVIDSSFASLEKLTDPYGLGASWFSAVDFLVLVRHRSPEVSVYIYVKI